MDLAHALDAHADAAARDSAQRLASDASKSLVRAQVTRGRRIHTFGVATGVAAAAVILMATGAWAGPYVFGEPTQIAPVAPLSSTPSATPSPSIEDYAATPLAELPGPGDVGYYTPMLGAYRTSMSQQCHDMTTVPMSQEGSPFPGYVSGLPTWLMPQFMYSGDPIPLYYADSNDYEFYLQSVFEHYPADHVNTVAFINPEGGWWGFTATYTVLEQSELHPAGIYLELQFDATCFGGDRTYGGPLPAGIYRARMLTTPQSGEGPAVVRDLGPVEVRPWNTIDVAS